MRYSEVMKMRITELCRQRNISYNALAKMSGVPQGTINEIISLKTESPGLRTLNKIAHAFCMTVSEFLDFPEMNEGEFEDDEKGTVE